VRLLVLVLLLAVCPACSGEEPDTAPPPTAPPVTAPSQPSLPAADVLRNFRPYVGARQVHETARNRVFVLPEGVPAGHVRQHYERQFRGWEHRDEHRGNSSDGSIVFVDYFWRDGHCVWLDIGTGAPGVETPPGRTMSIWAEAGPRATCA
jgi:hypothetical protein